MLSLRLVRSARAFKGYPVPHCRFYSDSLPVKASVKLVAELRKITDVSITKAKDALVATNNNVEAALQWLEKDLESSGLRKADKVRDRAANEGLIAVSVLSKGAGGGEGERLGEPIRAAMIELNCETDFVGRNKLFSELARDIAHTAAFFAEPQTQSPIFHSQNLEGLLNAPLVSPSRPDAESLTIEQAIRNAIVHVGENISLRRSVVTALDATISGRTAFRLASYVHGSTSEASQGRIGALSYFRLRATGLDSLLSASAFRSDLEKLERSLLRQIVGFDTRSIVNSAENPEPEHALYSQPFAMLAGAPSDETVQQCLLKWAQEKGISREANGSDEFGVDVVDFKKWTLGEPIEEEVFSESV